MLCSFRKKNEQDKADTQEVFLFCLFFKLSGKSGLINRRSTEQHHTEGKEDTKLIDPGYQ